MKKVLTLFTDITVEESATVSGGGHHTRKQESCGNPPTISQPPFILKFAGLFAQIIGQ